MLVFVNNLEFAILFVMLFHIELTIMYYYGDLNIQVMWYRVGYVQM